MTACTNHGGKARRVVTAALVGVLSVGTVPMVALATGTGDGVSLMAVDSEAIQNGKVTYRNGESGATFTYNGRRQGLIPSSVTPKGGSATQNLQLQTSSNIETGYYYFYVDMDGTSGVMDRSDFSNVVYVNADGIRTDLDGDVMYQMPDQIGNYAVVTGHYDKTTGVWDCVDLAATFSIAPQSLEGATIFEGNDMEDTTFTFSGFGGTNTGATLAADMNVALDGVRLAKGTDYTLTIIDPKTGAEATVLSTDTTYRAHIEGIDNYAGQVEDVDFVYGKCNLAELNIVGKVEQATAPTAPYTISGLADLVDGQNPSGFWFDAAQVGIEFVSGPNGAENDWTAGRYTFKITAAKDSDWFTGEKSFDYINANKEATVSYGNQAWDTVFAAGEYNVDLSQDNPATFDVSKISASYDAGNVPASQVKVTVTKADGTTATADDLKGPGTFNVDVEIYYTDANGDIVAQQESVKVVNYYQVVEASDVFFTYDGKNVENSQSVVYANHDYAPDFGIQVYAGSKLLTEGTDYTVKYEKQQSDGKWAEVDSIIDAGDYRISVVPVTFELAAGDDGAISVEVTRANLTAKVDGMVTDRTTTGSGNTDDGTFLPYTGSAQTVTLSFFDAKGNEVELSSDDYNFVVSKHGETKETVVKDVQPYDVTVDDYDSENYTVSNKTFTFWVFEADSFADVVTGKWYVAPVYQAKENGYVNGLKGTKLFNPETDITRADAVCIIYNMAGGKKVEEMSLAEKAAWTSKVTFTDVDTDQYYGVAIGWAESLDIANGFGGEFRPNDTITREEFAALLSNYAKATGDYEAVDADEVLGSATDYSAWAKDVVAWAKANGVMGNGGYIDGTGNITRAEVAAMAVNYQPAPLA